MSDPQQRGVFLNIKTLYNVVARQHSECKFLTPRLASNGNEAWMSRMLLLVGNGRSEANIAKLKAILDHLMGNEKVRYL